MASLGHFMNFFYLKQSLLTAIRNPSKMVAILFCFRMVKKQNDRISLDRFI